MELVAQAVQDVHLVVDDQQGMSPSLHPVVSGRLHQGRISLHDYDRIIRSNGPASMPDGSAHQRELTGVAKVLPHRV